MSYDEFRSLCKEAWREKQKYLLMNRLEEKNASRYKICEEANIGKQIFKPETDPF